MLKREFDPKKKEASDALKRHFERRTAAAADPALPAGEIGVAGASEGRHDGSTAA
jgi:hypothetical protein